MTPKQYFEGGSGEITWYDALGFMFIDVVLFSVKSFVVICVLGLGVGRVL